MNSMYPARSHLGMPDLCHHSQLQSLKEQSLALVSLALALVLAALVSLAFVSSVLVLEALVSLALVSSVVGNFHHQRNLASLQHKLNT